MARFIHEFAKNPRSGEVYNLGGGKANSCSILEAFQLVERLTGRPQRYSYVAENRKGDHICYYSDLQEDEGPLPGLGRVDRPGADPPPDR